MDKLRLIRSYGMAMPVGLPRGGRRKFGVPPGGAFDPESLLLANALTGRLHEPTGWEVAGQAEFEVAQEGTVATVGSGECRAWRVCEGQRITISGFRSYVAFGQGAERRLAEPPGSLAPGPLRIVPGPQHAIVRLAPRAMVSPMSNRVGMRLDGEVFPHSLELPSEPACVGAVQITNSGQPIILGPDGPTIGGYPKAAVVVRADLPRLAHLVPGSEIEFEWVTFEQADDLYREGRARIARRIAELGVA